MLGLELAVIPAFLIHTSDFTCPTAHKRFKTDIDIIYQIDPAQIITDKTEKEIQKILTQRKRVVPHDAIYIYDASLNLKTNIDFEIKEISRHLCGYVNHVAITISHSARTYIPLKYNNTSCEYQIAEDVTKELDRNISAYLKKQTRPLKSAIKPFLESRTEFGPFTIVTKSQEGKAHKAYMDDRYISHDARRIINKHRTESENHQFRQRLISCKNAQNSY